MIPKDPAAKLAYYEEFARTGMGPLAPSFGYGGPHGPRPCERT